MHRRFYFLLLLITSSACGRCDAEKPPPVQPAASSAVSTSPSAEPVPARGTDAIEPVYPKIAGPPDPRAEKSLRRFARSSRETPGRVLQLVAGIFVDERMRSNLESCASGQIGGPRFCGRGNVCFGHEHGPRRL